MERSSLSSLVRRLSSVVFFLLLSLPLFAEKTKPLSGLNVEDFQKVEGTDLRWKNNPFIRPTEEIDVHELKLFAIVYRKQDKAALISGDIVREGDKIGFAEVVHIERSQVVLRNEEGIFSFSIKGVSKNSQEDTELYSVEVRQAPLRDIIHLLATMDEKNVIIPDKIEGVATASFEATQLEEALMALLEANDLGAIIRDNIVQVATRESLEKLGEDLTTRTFPLKYAKARGVEPQVSSLVSARGSVMVDERSNLLTVRDTPVYLKDVETLIANIDTLDRQVLIEAKVLEAKVDFVRSLGVQWGASKTTGDVRVSGLTTVGTAQSGRTLSLSTPASGLGGANPLAGVALAFGGTLSDVQLTTAEQRGDVNILSRPSIVTMNNQAATINSGITFFVKTTGDVTIGGAGGSTTTTGSTSGSNLQQIKAGITLKVTPQITVDDKVNLLVEVTESQPDFSRVVDGIPTILDNNATTTVLLNDGETTVIGGLFQIQGTKTKRGVPGFQRIPLFGALFRSTTKGNAKNELLIFIKPTIVKEGLAQLPHYYEEDSILRDSDEKKQKQVEEKEKIFEKRKKSEQRKKGVLNE